MWDFENGDGTATGSCGTDCDLTDTDGSSITAVGTHVYGTQAISLTGANGDDILNTNANASLAFSGAETLSCWVQWPNVDPIANGQLFNSSGVFGNGVRLTNWFDGSSLDVAIGTGNGNNTDAVSSYGTFVQNQWYFLYGVATAGQGASDVGEAGVFSSSNVLQVNSVTTGADMVNATGGTFGFNANHQTVYLDECILGNVAMTQASLCRICACGLNGTTTPDGSPACTCNGASWQTTGAATTACGNCDPTGEPCNAVAPGAR